MSLIVVSVLFSGGCDKPAVRSESQRPMRVVVDDLGRRVSVPVKIERVVSLAPSVTESVFAAGAGERLVGVTTFCNYPEQAKSIAKVGDTTSPNMETIVALKPDLVLVSMASQIEAFTKTLEGNGIAVYVVNPTTPDEVIRELRKLGDLLGTSEVANGVADELDRRVQALSSQVGGGDAPTVFVQISKEPLFTIGRGAFLTGLVKAAGGRSITADVETAFPKLSKETAAALNPEVIILSDSEDNGEPNDAFKNSPALRNGRVYKINADIISRPGPRLVDALEEIVRDLHPESK